MADIFQEELEIAIFSSSECIHLEPVEDKQKIKKQQKT